jgi:hypothetical protein
MNDPDDWQKDFGMLIWVTAALIVVWIIYLWIWVVGS